MTAVMMLTALFDDKEDSYGYFGRGTEGYIHYDETVNSGGSSGGGSSGGGGGNGGGNRGMGVLKVIITIIALYVIIRILASCS